MTADAGRLLFGKEEWRRRKGECCLEERIMTAGAARENVDFWCRKGECRQLVQEGRMLTAGAGRENADCWCSKGEC